MRFIIRQLIKNPGFTVAALLTLALGIGVSTTAFTVLNRLMLQALPFRDPDRLVQVWATSSHEPRLGLSPGEYGDIRDQATSFTQAAAYYVNYMASLAEGTSPPERTTCLMVTAEFAQVVGIEPVLGRLFTPEEQKRGDGLALLSHSLWQSRFGGDPKVLGRSLRIDGRPITVIGVLPSSMDEPMLFGNLVALWLLDNTEVNRNYREKGWYQLAARLKPGVTLQQSRAEMKTLGARFAHDFAKTNADRGLEAVPYPTNSIGETGSRLTWLVLALSLVVLLVGCANLANLQLVRTTRRSREIAIRLAMGCPRWNLLQLLLGESLLVSIVGGALGLLVAKWGNHSIANTIGLDMPLDWRVMGFALCTATATGALFGSLPALLAARTDINRTLKQGGSSASSDRSRHRLRQALIVVELALSLTLLSGAGYFIRGLHRMTHAELGWKARGTLVGLFSLPHDRYGEERDERSRVFGERFRADLLALPGIDHAVVSASAPLFGSGEMAPFFVEGRDPPSPGQEPIAAINNVTPDFFATFGMRLVQGRDFTEADRAGSPRVVIVNQAVAKKFWPAENPLGKRIGTNDPANREWYEVVGVVNDVRSPFELGAPFQAYRPLAQNSHRFLSFALHGSTTVQALSDGARKALARLEPDIAMTFSATTEEIMRSQLAIFALVQRLLVEIAILGLLLSAIGIYGVIANLTGERTQEIGVRMALGAQPTDVLWLFLRNGVRLVLLGTAIGLITAYGLMRVLNSAIAMVPGNDPWVIVAVAGLLALVALTAFWLPARRATQVSPLVALRTD
jgi:predicted permease